MRKSVIFLAMFICFVLTASVNAQIKEVTSKDVRLVKDQPHVYISFESEGKRKPFKTEDSNRGVWLRFHNNSKWQVGVCMWDVPKEYGDKDVTYEVERYENVNNSEQTPIANDPEGSCPRVFIVPGKSVLFSVPREHLADGLAIKVLFRYEWETESRWVQRPTRTKALRLLLFVRHSEKITFTIKLQRRESNAPFFFYSCFSPHARRSIGTVSR